MTTPDSDDLETLRTVERADVYKAGRLAAALTRTADGVEFGYLDDWLATRVDHLHARLPWLWLGLRGRLTPSGIDQALRRRACAAGLKDFHAHQFRHTFAHRWLLSGEREGDLMTLAGWRTRQTLDRYGAAAAEQRAVRAYQRFSTEVAE